MDFNEKTRTKTKSNLVVTINNDKLFRHQISVTYLRNLTIVQPGQPQHSIGETSSDADMYYDTSG